MRNARPLLLVVLYLTAFAGYSFNCIIVCRSIVSLLLILPLETNLLIAYCTSVRGVHDTYDLNFKYTWAGAFQYIFCFACFINLLAAPFFL